MARSCEHLCGTCVCRRRLPCCGPCSTTHSSAAGSYANFIYCVRTVSRCTPCLSPPSFERAGLYGWYVAAAVAVCRPLFLIFCGCCTIISGTEEGRECCTSLCTCCGAGVGGVVASCQHCQTECARLRSQRRQRLEQPEQSTSTRHVLLARYTKKLVPHPHPHPHSRCLLFWRLCTTPIRPTFLHGADGRRVLCVYATSNDEPDQDENYRSAGLTTNSYPDDQSLETPPM